jgi:endonuclease/exonuclease/phosphatase family metal-dependent hydrolase
MTEQDTFQPSGPGGQFSEREGDNPALLIRSWNVFHGNAYPRERRAFLAEMVRLASADRPDVLCLQELPVWSLRCLDEWSGMTSAGDVAKRPLLPDPLARWITDLHNAFFRSAFTGQANAILLARELQVVEHRAVQLSRPEHRICQAVRLENGCVVANLHASGRRLGYGEEELEPALELVDELAGRVTILAGDFNLRPILPGFSAPGPGIDHILVRGATPGLLEIRPVERRTLGGRVLSDHAPVELRVDALRPQF